MDLKTWLDIMPSGESIRLAEKLGVSSQTIYGWRDNPHSIPPQWVLPLWINTAGEVHPYDVRPDIYPRGIVTFDLSALDIQTPAPQRGRKAKKDQDNV